MKEKFELWLSDSNSLSFQILQEQFHDYGFKPKDMIPQYNRVNLTTILKSHNLEILRTGNGEYILIKSGDRRKIRSIFPLLPEIKDIYEGSPFNPIYSDSILLNAKLMNEESGLFLVLRSGIISAFLLETIGGNHVFSHSGRIRKHISGEIYLGEELIEISSTQMERDGILESDSFIIPIEAKKGLSKSFSIHQLIFPMLLLRDIYPEKEIKGLILFFKDKPSWYFQLHLLDVPLKDGRLDITKYQFIGSKEYRIRYK